jgi:Fe-S-cluster containining protein
MRDGVIRRSLKAAARVFFGIDVGLDRWRRTLRGERPHGLGGECRRCARCCEAPAVRANAAVWHLQTLRRAFLWWQERVNGFELTQTLATTRLFVFRCSHFDWATRSCDSYDSRPGMCRDYPRALLFQAAPEMLPGCGYRPVAPNAAGLRRALEERGLPPAQLERLKKDLHLEP